LLTELAEQPEVNTYVIQDHQLVRPAALVVADGEENAMTGDNGNQLLSEQHQKYPADGREVEVVQLEQEAELEGWPVAHQFPPAEDYNVVCDQDSSACFESRDGGLAGHESKVLRLVAHGRLVDLLEDGPYREAERTVESRHTEFNPLGSLHGARCGGDRG
jgi:hypothetical protein